jgi:hypothetical protein
MFAFYAYVIPKRLAILTCYQALLLICCQTLKRCFEHLVVFVVIPERSGPYEDLRMSDIGVRNPYTPIHHKGNAEASIYEGISLFSVYLI